jgi:YD repeat-containing protein
MKNYISIVAVLFWGLSCLPFAKAEETGLISQYVITPTATDIVLSSDIQVSYFTGQANITIPLYETSQLGIPFHVSLNYDGSGYLVNKLPGWTGHGWSLSAGGAITRVQQGQIDEWKRPACLSASETEYSEGYLYHPGLAVSYLDTICGHLYNGSMLSEEHWWFWVKDLQPDIFYFNACGLSGRFFLGNDGEWKVLSDQNVRVEFDIHDESNFISPFIAKYPDLTDCYQPKTIKGFTLIDDKGIRYTFGGSSDAIDYSIPISGIGYECNKTGYSWCANAWYLTRIEDRLGNLLYSLEYERGFFVTHASYRRQESFAIGEASYINNYTTYGIQTRTSAMSFSNSPFKYYSFSISAPTYLSAVHLMDGTTLSFHSGKAFSTDSIAYPSLYNRFYKYSGGFFKEHYDKIMGRNDALYRYYYLGENHEAFMQYKYDQNEQRCKEDPFRATGLKCLDSITVSCNNSIIRKISIRYNEKAPKMHITQVSMTNAEGGDVQQYDLSYNNFEALPSDYLASDFDDWGYYCCEDSVMTKDYEMEEHIVYTGPNTYYVFYTPKEGSVREYAYYRNPEKSKYGNLASIVYPTGGKATFQYEINNYSRYLERNRQSIAEADSVTWCGGLRIRSISLYDKADSDTCSSKREFFYELEDGLSSGELSALPEHVFEWNPSGWMSNSLWVLTVSESSVIPLQTSFGPHVGYSRVVEKNAGEQTIYTYSNFSDSKKDEPYFVYFQPSVTPFDSYGEVGYRRGRLLSIQKMDKNGQKRYESNNIYRTDSIENSFVLSCDRSRGVAGNTTNQLDPLLFGYPTGGFYKMFYPKYDVIRTEEMFYDDVQNAAGCTTDYHKTDYEGDRFDRSVVRTWNGTAHSQDQASSDSIVYRYSFDCRNGLPENDLLANQCEYWNDFSSQHFYPVLEEKTFWDGHRIKTSVVKYGKYNSNQLLLQSSSEIGIEEKKRTDYLGYSVLGLPTHIREKGKPVYQLFWDNEKILAIAVNGDSLPITMDTGNGLLVNGQSPYGTSNTLAKIVQYNGLNQISGITDEFGLTHYYRYDGMGRLDSILDHHNRLTESYTYHYQQNGENRVEVLTVLNGDNTDNMLSVNYYNGLGRLTQVTAQGISPLGLVSSYTEYDQKGRKSIIWSPVPMGNEVAMQTVQDYVSLSEATYGEGFGYEKTEYDVMDRVVKTIRPGELWHNQDKGIITQYGFCPSGTVKKYLYQNGVLQEDGYYEQGDLKMISTIDEDGYRKTIYMDYRDRIILERKHQILSDTYYIYN